MSHNGKAHILARVVAAAYMLPGDTVEISGLSHAPAPGTKLTTSHGDVFEVVNNTASVLTIKDQPTPLRWGKYPNKIRGQGFSPKMQRKGWRPK